MVGVLWQHCSGNTSLPALRCRERRVKLLPPNEPPRFSYMSGIVEGGMICDFGYDGLIMYREECKTYNPIELT